MLSEGRSFIQQAPWIGIFPDIAILFTMMGFNFLSDGLRKALDSKLKQVLGDGEAKIKSGISVQSSINLQPTPLAQSIAPGFRTLIVTAQLLDS
jgi:hypothetical protein